MVVKSPVGTPPTAQEIARQLLRILVLDLRLTPNDEIPDLAMRRVYEAGGGKADDIAAGLRFAHENGWVTYKRNTDRFYLAAAGATEDVLGPR